MLVRVRSSNLRSALMPWGLPMKGDIACPRPSTNGLSVVGACAVTVDEARCARLRGLSTNCCLVLPSAARTLREQICEEVRPRIGRGVCRSVFAWAQGRGNCGAREAQRYPGDHATMT